MQHPRYSSPDEWLAPWVPSPADPFDRRQAAHLGRRAAFGFTDAELAAAVAAGPQATIERLLSPPAGSADAFAALLAQIEGELLDLKRDPELQAWWIYRMLHAPDPLREKVTLFWHGHFATSARKVERIAFMQQQNETFRTLGLGPFRDLLLAVAKDPAMLVWLDNRSNRKGRPNENFARELLELFTLGLGSYSESDVKEVARAFTGWHLREDRFFFDKGAHDDGDKTVLGVSGKLDGEQVLDVVLQQPACARFLAAKLYAFFVGPPATAPDGVLEALAERLRTSGYRIDAWLRTLLQSRLFFDPSTYRARIKSPVELVLGAVRSLELRTDCRQAGQAIAQLGQALFAPPTVKGWDGEAAWLSAQWLVNRANTAMNIAALRGNGAHESRFEPLALLERRAALRAGTPDAVVDCFAELLLDGAVPDGARALLASYMVANPRDKKVPFDAKNRGQVESKARGIVHLLMTMPEYQLA